MNGTLAPNGTSQHNGQAEDDIGEHHISQIVQTLMIIHNPASTPNDRTQAHMFLDEVQRHRQATYCGIVLASNPSQSPIVRHYGLSLIEQSLKRSRYNSAAAPIAAIQACLVQLAENINENDPSYVRNKLAVIWVEYAKLQWARDWMNMDELFCSLWTRSLLHKELVAVILESLSEDIFRRDDLSASLRAFDLTRACYEIFLPLSLSQANRSSRVDVGVGPPNVRYGEEGWLNRFADFLDWSVPDQVSANEQCRVCTLKVYAALKSAMAWIQPSAMAATRCVERLSKGLLVSNYQLQLAAVESLNAIYNRSSLAEEHFISLVCPMFRPECVRLLQELYQWSTVDPSDIDHEKYTLAKKLSEMISVVASSAQERFNAMPTESDLHGFMRLLLDIFGSPSLAISIPALSAWSKIIRSESIGNSEAATALIGRLIDLCHHRLIRFEHLPEDSEDPTILFLNEDIDTIPEKHTFIGNYRRFCTVVVEAIVLKRPLEALEHVLTQVEQAITALFKSRPSLQVQTYTKYSLSYLQIDAHLAMMESTLKGYMKWVASQGSGRTKNVQERNAIDENLEGWCERLLGMDFEDPLIKKRVLQVAVQLATSVLQRENFTLRVLQEIFTSQPLDQPAYLPYSDAVKELQSACTHDLHQLAYKMPDFLMTVYDDLEAKINEIIRTYPLDYRPKIAFQTFLFIIIHRTATIKDDMRASRLIPIVKSIEESWSNPELNTLLESFQGFCELVGVQSAQQYFLSRQANQIKDWPSCALDDEGKAIQAQITERGEQIPIRATKSFLSASVEKIQKDTDGYKFAGALWQSAIPVVIPRLLKLLRYSHAYYNVQGWAENSQEMKDIVSRALSDRFWQAGISSGSKDEFYAKVSSTRATLEGLASALRGVIRNTRDACYSVIYCMSSLTEQFYFYDELPGPLAEALFTDAGSLTPHQFTTMISMMRYLVDNCPSSRREKFLTPILSNWLIQVDNKVTTEWNKISQTSQANSEDESLDKEMKDESILRQFTYSCVFMVAGLLDPERESPSNANSHAHHQEEPNHSPAAATDNQRHGRRASRSTAPPPESLRAFILSSVDILQQLLSFCIHIIRTPDTRCCSMILRVLRSLSRDVCSSNTELAIAAREYLCTDGITAAVTSFHDTRFVDVQREIVTFIATLYLSCATQTPTPRLLLASLPGVTEESMETTHQALFSSTATRQSRALMSSLLEGVRGMSIAEQGKVAVDLPSSGDAPAEKKGSTSAKKEKVQRYRNKTSSLAARAAGLPTETMSDDLTQAGRGDADDDGRRSPDLTGVGELFDR
ncbi:MAG: hypothetical protein M1816_003807 [Peltula sp. TS41687]|nr:MAG: hypothetical protein M1816_003807 [Peltula sp. TS41687]